MEQQLELSAAYCNRWIISKQKINIYTKQLNEAKYMIGWGEDVFSARWNDGIRGIKWWLSLPKNFIQIFFGMYACYIVHNYGFDKFYIPSSPLLGDIYI